MAGQPPFVNCGRMPWRWRRWQTGGTAPRRGCEATVPVSRILRVCNSVSAVGARVSRDVDLDVAQVLALVVKLVAEVVEPRLVDQPGEPDKLAPGLVDHLAGMILEQGRVRVGGKCGLVRATGKVNRRKGRER